MVACTQHKRLCLRQINVFNIKIGVTWCRFSFFIWPRGDKDPLMPSVASFAIKHPSGRVVNAIQYNAIQCYTMQYNPIQCYTMQYNAIQCNTMQYNAIQCNTMQYNIIQYSTISAGGTSPPRRPAWRISMSTTYPRVIFFCTSIANV
jgi:hypothetical protein